MLSQKSQVEKTLETILKDQPMDNTLSLSQLLPESIFAKKSEQIKKNYADFIQSCLMNNKLIKQMIDRGVKTDIFKTEYQKNLALFSLDILSGDLGDSYKLFIKVDDQDSKLLRKSKSMQNQSEIQQQIQGQTAKAKEQSWEKYQNFSYLLQYIRRPLQQISPVCMNYFSKIMTTLVTNKAQHVYAYFAEQNLKYFDVSEEKSIEAQTQVRKKIKNEKTDLQLLVELAYSFGGVSEMLGKMIAEQGAANKYIEIKKLMVQSVIKILKNEETIKKNTQNYQYLLDFVAYVLSRTKYRSDDKTDELSRVSQRFVDEDVVWFYRQKIIKAVVDSNSLNNSFMTSSGSLSHGNKKQIKVQLQIEQEIRRSEIIFQNSIQYLKILSQRLNSQEQVDPYSYTYSQQQKQKNAEPTMDFQVNEIIFGENSIFELMTLPIPFKYKNINKMSYYQFLLKLTRNSRFKDPNNKVLNGTQPKNEQNHMGLLRSSLLPTLTHLLKTFRRQYKNNGLTNFYIQEIICEALLPRILKLEDKQAMMVLSALNPTEQLLKKQDTRVYCNKLFVMLQKKCQWFTQHFSKIGVDVRKIMSGYIVRLGISGNNDINPQNKKYIVKQFQFIEQEKAKQIKQTRESKVGVENKLTSQKYEDDNKSSSSSSSSDDQKQFQKRQFEYPSEMSQKSKSDISIGINSNSAIISQGNMNLMIESENVEQGLLRISDQEINDSPKNQKDAKQKLMELLVDSAGEQDQNSQNEVRRDETDQSLRNGQNF